MLRTIKQNSSPLGCGAAASILLLSLFIDRAATGRPRVSFWSMLAHNRRRAPRRDSCRNSMVISEDLSTPPPLIDHSRLDPNAQISRIVARVRDASLRIAQASKHHKAAVTQLDCLEIGLEDLRADLTAVMPNLAPVLVKYGSNRKESAAAKSASIAA